MLPLSSLFELTGEGKGKPALVYVYDADTEDEELERLERKAFGREDFIITTKLYRCYRIEESSMDEKSRKQLGKLPAYLVLDAAGNTVAEANGKMTSKKLLRRMAKGMDKAKGKRVKKIVKNYQKFLAELMVKEDAIAELKKQITSLEERIEKNDSKSAKKNLGEKQAELAELEKELTELEERGRTILADEKPTVARR